MSRFHLKLSAIVLPVLLVGAASGRAAATNEAPDFKEVYDLVRAHLAGTSETELNRAAVEGLLASLPGKVSLIGGAPASTNTTLVSKSSVLDEGVAYVRVGRVDDGLAKAVSAAYQQLRSANKLKGLVLDLRFADGDDYAAAAAAADLFVAKERPLLDWGDGIVKSKEKADAISLPVAVLVNQGTRGAAEALGAMLRESGTGLILGSATAGQAMTGQEFSLKDGRRLRIATAPVKLGDGTALSAQGVKPDIEVAVSAASEREYLKDAYAILPTTNSPANSGLSLAGAARGADPTVRRPRLTEAELVREKRESAADASAAAPASEAEAQPPQISDPALARAVDLLKGLALVRQARS